MSIKDKEAISAFLKLLPELVSFPLAIRKYYDKSNVGERGLFWLIIPGYGPSQQGSQGGQEQSK